MSKVLVEESNLSSIASAIRSKAGGSSLYKPSEMAAAIGSIPAGITPTGTVNISQNGTVDVTQYASAAVNVPNSYSASDEGKVVYNGALVAQTARSSHITENGTYDTTLNNEIVVDITNQYGKNILDISRYGSPQITRSSGSTISMQVTESNDTNIITVSGDGKIYDSYTWNVPINAGLLFQGCKLRVDTDDSDLAFFVANNNSTILYALARKSNPVVTIQSYGSYANNIHITAINYGNKSFNNVQMSVKITGI